METDTRSPTVAERLADFAVAAGRGRTGIPAAVREQAAQRILDNIGCMIHGLRVEPARAVAELAAGLGQGPCHVLSGPPGPLPRTSATAAALAHGTLAQAFEMNDLGVYVHPGACIVPAALAAIDQTGIDQGGDATVADLVRAVVAGYEVTVRLSEWVGPAAELEIGWHTPGFHGAVGAAVAAGLLMGADSATLAQAIVIAADIAGGGLMMARLGSDVKRLHCGRAAETGVLAALLAQRGIRSRLDTIEHKDWGYVRTMNGGAERHDRSEIERGLGERFVAFERTAVKYYPVGAEMMGVIDSIGRLKARHGLPPSAIERIAVGTPRFFHTAQAHEYPRGVSEIHFNVEYAAAMAVLHDIRPVHESPDVLDLWMTGYGDPEVRRLAALVRHEVDEELDRRNPYGIDSVVEIRLHGGATLREETRYVRDAGSPGTMRFAPMEQDKIVRKFRNASRHRLPEERQSAVIGALLDPDGTAAAAAVWQALDTA